MLPKIQHPISTTTLPDSKTVVKYRPFLRSEEKIFLMAKESKSEEEIENATIQVINNCTMNGIDAEALSPLDLEFMLLQLMIASKGQTSEIGLKCKNHVEIEEREHPVHGKIPAYSGPCNTTNTIILDLADVEVNLPNDGDKTIMITDEIGLQMVYPSKEVLKKHPQIESDDQALSLIYDCIESIFDSENVYSIEELDDRQAELNAFFDEFNDEQIKKVVGFFKTLPSLSMKVDFTCKKCGYKDELTLKGLTDFF